MAEEEPTTRDFLGREAPIAFKSQPALPAAGGAPVGASAAPAAPGGTGALVGGGGAAEKANAPSEAIQQALRALGLAGRFGDIATKVSPGSPSAGVPAAPQELLGPSGRFGEPGSGGDLGLSIESSAPAAAPAFDYVQFLSDYPSSYVPYLAAAQAIPSIVGRAESGTLPAGEQALMDIVDLVGAAFSPATFGLSSGLSGALDQLIGQIFGEPHVPHRIRELQGEAGVGNALQGILEPLAAAGTPEEIWAAFEPTTTQNFRTGRHTGYPIFATGEDITEASLMKALASGDPNALDFGFQAGISADVLPQANQALNQATRQQAALIQAAQAGEPTAQAILAQRKAARGAELAANEQAHLAFLRQPYAGYTGDAP